MDAAWVTRSARIRGRSAGGFSSALLEADGGGHWLVDAKPACHLDGCLDVDFVQVVVDGARAEVELGGYLAVGQAVGDRATAQSAWAPAPPGHLP